MGARARSGIADAAKPSRIALVGETEHDAREVMIEGVVRPARACIAQRRAAAMDFLAAAAGMAERRGRRRHFPPKIPESLRGPQFSAAWCDELAKWRHAEATFDMLQFGLRLGERPRQVDHHHAAADRAAQAADRRSATAVTRAGTRANAFTSRRRSSTRWSRATAARGSAARRLDGEIDRGARRRAVVARADRGVPRGAAPPLLRIVVAVDPPASARQARRRLRPGRGGHRARTARSTCSPTRRVRGAVARRLGARRRSRCGGGFEADALVAEVNQGGDMVRAVIARGRRDVPVTPVRATRGK